MGSSKRCLGEFKKTHVYALVLLHIKSNSRISLEWCITLLYFYVKAVIKGFFIDECSKDQQKYKRRLSAGGKYENYHSTKADQNTRADKRCLSSDFNSFKHILKWT